LYRGFQAGTIGSVLTYPLIFMSLLEIPLILLHSTTRVLPVLVTLGVVAWQAQRASRLTLLSSQHPTVPEQLP
jgi:hypothetical protein